MIIKGAIFMWKINDAERNWMSRSPVSHSQDFLLTLLTTLITVVIKRCNKSFFAMVKIEKPLWYGRLFCPNARSTDLPSWWTWLQFCRVAGGQELTVQLCAENMYCTLVRRFKAVKELGHSSNEDYRTSELGHKTIYHQFTFSFLAVPSEPLFLFVFLSVVFDLQLPQKWSRTGRQPATSHCFH